MKRFVSLSFVILGLLSFSPSRLAHSFPAQDAALERFDEATETFEHYAFPAVLAILEDRQGGFWLGSGAGLIAKTK